MKDQCFITDKETYTDSQSRHARVMIGQYGILSCQEQLYRIETEKERMLASFLITINLFDIF